MAEKVDNCSPYRLSPEDEAVLVGVLSLLRRSFAYMEGRIDPPSSTHGLTQDDIRLQAQDAEIWVVEDDKRVIACVFLSPQDSYLYLSRLSVAKSHRGRGLARRLVDLAQERARSLGLSSIELKSRVELTENHSAFTALGFQMVGEVAHPGFDEPTSLKFVLPL